MSYLSISRNRRNLMESKQGLTPTIQEKSFSSFSIATGKIRKFYPKPTLSQSKSYQKQKNTSVNQDSIRAKIQRLEKPQDHTKYFDKLEVSCKLPTKRMRELRMSEATTSPNFGDNSRQIEEPEEVRSLNWNKIRRSPPLNLMEKLVINCNPYVNISTNFCTCDYPCKWGSKWEQWSQKRNIFQYQKLQKIPMKADVDVQIKKDLKRTQPQNRSFQIQSNLEKLEEVLQSYAKYDQDLEYVQGMNLIASVILYHMKRPQRTFWVFVDLMERKDLKKLYLNKFQLLFTHTKILKKLIYLKINDLYNYLQQLQLDIDTIMVGWVLSLMLKVIPLQFSHLVIDSFIREGFLSIYKIILTYLIYLKEELFIRNDSSDVLYRLSPSCQKGKDQNWQEILLTAEDMEITEKEIKEITRGL